MKININNIDLKIQYRYSHAIYVLDINAKNRKIFSTQGKILSIKLVSINHKEIISYRTYFWIITRLS